LSKEQVSDQADLTPCHADPPVIVEGVSEHTDLAISTPPAQWPIPWA